MDSQFIINLYFSTTLYSRYEETCIDHFNTRSNEAFAMPVSTQKADTELWIKTLNSVGSVSADQGINVTASLPGIVDKIYFKSGDSVIKGSALVRQDTSILAAELKGSKLSKNYVKSSLTEPLS